MIGAVSAVNETDVIEQDSDLNDVISEDIAEEEILDESATPTEVTTTIQSRDTNIVKGNDFSVELKDSNSTPLTNQTVQFTLNNEVTNAKTDGNGIAKLKINLNPGTYTVKYSFSGDGYVASSNSTEIFVISSSATAIKGSDYVAYEGVKNVYTVVLTVGGAPLANRLVVFKINGKTLYKRTNANGKASIYIDENKGTYNLTYTYNGEDNINKCSGSSKITVKKGMPVKIVKYYSKVYRSLKWSYFKIKVTDSRGQALASQKVTFKLKGKSYVKKTDSKGIATLKIHLKKGSYKVRAIFAKTPVYNYKYFAYKITVKPAHGGNNGMWLFALDMDKVNFNTLQKYGTKHIFLNFYCFKIHSKSYIESWIKKAGSRGIKVHIWMQAFYGDNGWASPVKNGKYNYKLINSKVREAVKYARVKGVAGVHIDYVRYPGTAYKHPGAVNGVNLFVKKVSAAVHKVNKKLIVSAAVMPEPNSMKYYYAQDIRTMGKYLDVIVPMAYKGNYHAGTNWIKYITNTFKKQSSKAKIWTGLQPYRSDSNVVKIPAKELLGDANAAINGGADGVILFRFGLFNYINFRAL